MKSVAIFQDHVFNLSKAHFLADNRYVHVGKTEQGSWFVYDEAAEEIVAALFVEVQDSDSREFAEALLPLDSQRS
jgi:hypothetical protein